MTFGSEQGDGLRPHALLPESLDRVHAHTGHVPVEGTHLEQSEPDRLSAAERRKESLCLDKSLNGAKEVTALPLDQIEISWLGQTDSAAKAGRLLGLRRLDKEVGLLFEQPVVIQGVSEIEGITGRHEGRLYLPPSSQASEDGLAVPPIWLGKSKLGDQSFVVDRCESGGLTGNDDPVVVRRQDVILEKRIDGAGKRSEMPPHFLAEVVERDGREI